MIAPLLVLGRRRLLPGVAKSWHIGREESFRRLNAARESKSFVFVASVDASGALERTGVMAHVMSLVRTPVERAPGITAPPGATDDRCELAGSGRARIAGAFSATAREVEVDNESEAAPRVESGSREEELLIAVAARALEIERELPWNSFPPRGMREALIAQGPLERIYGIASLGFVKSSTRQRVLEADGLLRKAEILRAALQDELDIRSLERRIATRL